MKRIFPIVLAAALLLLPGCQTESDGTVRNWNFFYWGTKMSQLSEATIFLFGDSTLDWNGSEYTITGSSGKRSYQHLVEFIDIQEVPGGWNYINEYVLTNAPDLTLAEYRSSGGGETVYSGTFHCASAASFGEAPKAVTDLIDRHFDGIRLNVYLPGSVFERVISGSMESREELVSRWSYSGELLCSFQVSGYTECFVELEDGSFLATLSDYANDTYQVNCHSRDGSILWSTALGEAEHPTLHQFLVCPEGIYGIGTIRREERFEDVYICHLSRDGELIQEVFLGGTNHDTVNWAEKTDAGFTLYGATQSSDGDFPVSPHGYRVDFVLELSPELEVLSARQQDHDYSYFSVRGYLDGNAVFYRDSVLAVSDKDNLPSGKFRTMAVFPYECGYVILRNHLFGAYPYQDPSFSHQASYLQIVATGYDTQGNPLWQTVSAPYID